MAIQAPPQLDGPIYWTFPLLSVTFSTIVSNIVIESSFPLSGIYP